MGKLAGRTILVVEDEAIIAIDLAQDFQAAGARIVTVRSRAKALEAIHETEFSAAVVDLLTEDGEAHDVCEQLQCRHVPYVIHSAAPRPLNLRTVYVEKPARRDVVVTAVERLLRLHEALAQP